MKTKSRAARAVKKAVTPAYGSKGKGAVTQPKKSLYNKAYSKTTFSWFTTRTCWNPGVSTPGGRQGEGWMYKFWNKAWTKLSLVAAAV